MKRFRAILLLVVVMVLTVSMMVSCKKKEAPQEAYGEYYYNISEEAVNGFVLSKEGYTLKEISGDKTGGYKYDGKKEEFIFDALDGKTAMTGKYVGGSFTLKIGDNTYECQKGKIAKVEYQTKGSAGIASKYVAENTVLTKPENPQSAGKVFVGWYTDATYKNRYDFTKKVTGDIVLHARFVATVEETFTVTYVNAGVKYGESKTNRGGIVENLPTPTQDGKEFLGWWLSDYQEENKLTRQYKDEVLKQNETLYAVYKSDAPAVSVDQEGVEWDNKGLAANYKVEILYNGSVLKTQTTSSTSYDYDFDKQQAGEYEIKVTINNKTTTAYYRNKSLPRVSIFQAEGNVLKFNAIEGAEKYKVTVVCGNPEHRHEGEVTTNSFDFSDCDMKRGGIEFRVEAIKAGYLSSESNVYTVERNLSKVSNIQINQKEEFTWDKLENAVAYMVSINGEKYVRYEQEISDSVKELSGTITITIYATAKGYNPADPVTFTYDKTRLATPKSDSITTEDNYLTWGAVEGAKSYLVKIGDKEYTSTTNKLSLADIGATAEEVEVTITAIAANTANNSLPTDKQIFANTLENRVTYSKNTVKWAAIFGVTEYEVKVNDNEPITVKGYSKEINLDKEGTNTIQVRYLKNATEKSDWERITVTAYKVTLSYNDGAAETYVYRAVGDDLKLQEVNRAGYTFKYWTKNPDDGAAYDKTTLDTPANLTLYAQWTANKYKVFFNYDGGELTETLPDGKDYQEITFGQNFKLPQAKDPSDVKAFAGWFTERNGTGTRVTDQFGNGYGNWAYADIIQVYAYFADIYRFASTKDVDTGNKAVSIIGTYDSIGLLQEITIPAKYNGMNVVILEGNAFKSCGFSKIRIPDSIQRVELGINGAYTTGSAFSHCANLEETEVYYVRGNHERRYASQDGILFYNNTTSDISGIEFNYLPQKRGKTSQKFVIPSSLRVQTGENDDQTPIYTTWTVEIIGYRALSSTSLTEITIPYTIKNVRDRAFYLSSYVTKVTFEETPAGETAVQLLIGSDVFYGCRKLEEINLPARLKVFSTSIFNYCQGLKRINITKSDFHDYKSIDGIVTNKIGDTLVFCPKGVEGEYTIPAGVSTIGEDAFSGCHYLTKVIIPEYVNTISKNAFYKCVGEVLEIDFLDSADAKKLTIEESAFYGCIGLTSVVLPERVQTIGAHAFGGCLYLTTVTVNSSGEGETKTLDYKAYAFNDTKDNDYESTVTTLNLGKSATIFNVAESLGDKISLIVLAEGNKSFVLDNKVLYNANKSKISYYPDIEGPYEAPDSLEEISRRIFANRLYLSQVTLKSGVKIIDAYAFYNCSGLQSVTIPADSQLATIGEYAFGDCTALTEIALPASLTSLQASADGNINVFDKCVALSSITVAENNQNYTTKDNILYSIDEAKNPIALLFCPAMYAANDGNVIVPATVKKINNKAFYNNNSIKTFKFEEGVSGEISFGSQVFNNCGQLTRVELPTGTTVIGTRMFSSCPDLTYIFVPNTVKTIGQYAFEKCAKLKEIEFESGNEKTILTLGTGKAPATTMSYIFNELPSFTTVTLPNRITDLPKYTFYNCFAITELNIPDSVKMIGQYMFYFNTNYVQQVQLQTVAFTANSAVTTISDYAFSKLLKLKNFGVPVLDATDETKVTYSMPKTVTTLGKCVFEDDSALEYIEIGAKVSALGNNTFKNCSSLKTVIFAKDDVSGKSVTKLSGTYVFSGCTSLESITLPEKVTVITNNTFDGCSKLTSVIMEGVVTSTGGYAFRNCVSLTSFVVPASVGTIGTNAFYGCVNLSSVTFLTYTKAEAEAAGKPQNENKAALKAVNNAAFVNTALTSIVFPESITGKITFGTGIFEDCYSLTSVTMSASCYDIGLALDKAPSVTTVILAEGSPYSMDGTLPLIKNAAGDNIIYLYGQLEEGEGKPLQNGEFVVSPIVKTISAYAFRNQYSLKKIYLPDILTDIKDYAFLNCYNLEELVFYQTDIDKDTGKTVAVYDENNNLKVAESPALKTIGKYAFAVCEKLNLFKLPASVMSVGEYAFFYCRSFKEITIPARKINFDKFAYAYCGATTLEIEANASGTTATLSVSMFEGCDNLTTVTLPNAVGFSKIPDAMFKNCSALDKIKVNGETLEEGSALCNLPLSVKEIGSAAFSASGVTSVYLHGKITKIASKVFASCYKLKKITFEENTNIATLDVMTFNSCTSLQEVDLRPLKNLNTIGGSSSSSVFAKCTSLETIYFPESLEYLSLAKVIGPATAQPFNGFEGCTNLKTVVISSQLKRIGPWAFSNCSSLTNLYYYENGDYSGELKEGFPETLSVIDYFAFQGTGLIRIDLSNIESSPAANKLGRSAFAFCKNLKEIKFGSKVSYLYDAMFEGCSSLQVLDLSKTTITALGGRMFVNCTNLQSVLLPQTCTSIGQYAFQNCKSLEEIDLVNAKTLGNYIFMGCTNLKTVIVSDKTLTLPDYAFANCNALEDIALPNALRKIGKYAFQNTAITSIVLPPYVSEIGVGVFSGCKNLDSVTIKSKILSSIGTQAFRGCENLKSFTITKSVTSIGTGAFGGCSDIKFVIEEGNTLFSITPGGALVDQKGTLLGYPTGNATTVDFSGISELGENAFYGNSNLTEVTIPASLEKIDAYAFANCVNLATVKFESGCTLKTIEERAFEGSGLTSFKVPTTVESIGKYAFANCGKLTEFTFADTENKLTLDSNAFYRSALVNITLPANIVFEAKSTSAFAECNSLLSATVNCDVICTYLFSKCAKLETVTIGNGVKELGASAFRYCESLKTVKLGESLEAIPSYAFGDSGLENITIPASVKVINSYAFNGCSDLVAVNFAQESALRTIEKNAFENSGITSFCIPANVASIGDYAFKECKALQNVTIEESDVQLTLAIGVFMGCNNVSSIVIPERVRINGYWVFEGWTAEQTVNIKNRAEIDVLFRWLGTSDCPKAKMVGMQSILPWWKHGIKAKIVWNYKAA